MCDIDTSYITTACKVLNLMSKSFFNIILTTIGIADGHGNLDLVMEDRYSLFLLQIEQVYQV